MKYDILQLNDMLVQELREIANRLEIPEYKKLSKQDLIYKILDAQAVTASPDNKSPEILVEDNTPYGKIPSALHKSKDKEPRVEKRPRKRLGEGDETTQPEEKSFNKIVKQERPPRFELSDRFDNLSAPILEPIDEEPHTPVLQVPEDDDDDDFINPALMEFDDDYPPVSN